MMWLECPICGDEFKKDPDFLRDGKHAEHKCSNGHCDQFLQWDWLITIDVSGSGDLQYGEPQCCQHPKKKMSGARVPLPVMR